jgi:hypothetical protein
MSRGRKKHKKKPKYIKYAVNGDKQFGPKLTYVDLKALETLVGEFALCGHIREPRKKDGMINGFCYKRQALGLEPRCYSETPMDRERCPIYIESVRRKGLNTKVSMDKYGNKRPKKSS